MKKSKIIIVDENDSPVGEKYREEVDSQKDTYRCTGIWITNSEDEILIAQRKFTKKNDPLKWGPAVSGTVEIGETYESNAYKELKEEIGISDIKLTVGPKYHSITPNKYFGQWFFGKIDKPANKINIQLEEVEQVKWIKKEDLMNDLKNNPDKYVPSFNNMVDLLI